MLEPEIIRLEQAILSTLEDLASSRGGAVRTLRGFSGPWKAARAISAVPSPAILLRYLGLRSSTPGSGQLGGWSRWAVTAAVGGGRDETGRRRGIASESSGPSAANAWALLGEIRRRLAGQVLVHGCGPLLARGEQPAEPDAGWAVWEQNWECSIPAADSVCPLLVRATGGVSQEIPAAQADQMEFDLGEKAAAIGNGGPVFICDPNGLHNVYLGHGACTEPGLVQCEKSPGLKYEEGAIVWIPSSEHEWSSGRYPPIQDIWDRGMVFTRDADGMGLAARLNPTRRSTTVGLGPLPSGEIEAFRVWLDLAARGGLDAITWVDERARVFRAWLQTASWKELEQEDGLISLSFDLALDNPGTKDT